MSATNSRPLNGSELLGQQAEPVAPSTPRAFRMIGIVLLVISALVTAVYAVDFDFAAYTAFRGELGTAAGTVAAVEPTDYFEPGTKRTQRDEHTRIVGIHFTFTGPDRVEHEGVSYLPGAQAVVGSRVTIEYPVGQPDVSRIRGYRSAKYDRLPIPLYLMAMTGLVLLAIGLVRRRED